MSIVTVCSVRNGEATAKRLVGSQFSLRAKIFFNFEEALSAEKA